MLFKNNTKTFIIAEAGVNHNGSLKVAKKLIDYAALAKADAIKFQSFKTSELVSVYAKKMSHQKRAEKKLSQFDLLKKLELTPLDHIILQKYCKKKKIIFLSSAFDIPSLKLLKKIKIPIFKIPSSEINNLPYLKVAGSYNKPTILSTGMSDIKEIGIAVKTLKKYGLKNKNLFLLHCTSQYPADYKNLNLNAIKTLKDKFNVRVGYSDHSRGLTIPLALASHNLSIYEKHFTLSRKLKGPDHSASLEPKELKKMITNYRIIENSMGSYQKKIVKCEKEFRKLGRKSLVAKKNIKKGQLFSTNNLSLKRPGTGMSPDKFQKLLGKKARKNYMLDELINEKI